jgi:hypothetical protein
VTTRQAAIVFVLCILVLGVLGLATNQGLAAGLIPALALALPSLWLCRRIDHDRVGLVTLFMVALVLRWIGAVVVELLIYRARPGLFAPDELHYHWASTLLGMYWRGEGPDPYPDSVPRGIVVVASALYAAFGFHALVAKMFLCVIGAWTAVLTALIAGQFTTPETARRAGWLAAVFPSLVLWSGLLIKDTPTLCGTQLALLAFLHLRARFQACWFAIFVAALFWVASDRPYQVIFLALAATASFVISGDRRLLRNALLFAAVSAVLLLIVKRSGADAIALGSGDTSFIERLASLRSAYAGAGIGSAVNVELVDTRTLGGLIAWVPIGLAYFFLAPIPFTGGSIISFATTPEMLVLYYLIPSFWRGLRGELKRRSRAFMTVFFFCLISAIGWSVAITNVGTIYRYRSQMFFGVLILVAIDQVRRRQEGLRA